MLNLHLICDYQYWVFGMEGWEEEECVLYLQVSMAMLSFTATFYTLSALLPPAMCMKPTVSYSPNKETSHCVLPNKWML